MAKRGAAKRPRSRFERLTWNTPGFAGVIFIGSRTKGEATDKISRQSIEYDIQYNNVYLGESLIVQVSKWGNSLAIRLPAAVVEALELEEGDDIEVVVADESTFGIRKKPSNQTLLKRLHKFRGRLPDDFVFDRESANQR